MSKNIVVLVGTLETVSYKKCEAGRVTYFTLICGNEKISCKVMGTEAENFESIAVLGEGFTVLGYLTSKTTIDGATSMGVYALHIAKDDCFDFSTESDIELLDRIAKTYMLEPSDEEEKPSEWTASMHEQYKISNKEERAYLRGRWGTPKE